MLLYANEDGYRWPNPCPFCQADSGYQDEPVTGIQRRFMELESAEPAVPFDKLLTKDDLQLMRKWEIYG
jgi:hypothetical protein